MSVQLRAGRIIVGHSRARQPGCCKLLVPNHGSAAKIRAGTKKFC